MIVINSYRNVVIATPKNLLRYSEELGNFAAWNPGGVTITDNTQADSTGAVTLDTFNDLGEYGSNQQTVTVLPNTQYTFSFEAKRGTATVVRHSIRNATAGTDITSRVDYYASINGTTPTVVSVTFTTPAGCTSINVYPFRPNEASTGTTHIGRAQLNAGATRGTYVKTEGTNVP